MEINSFSVSGNRSEKSKDKPFLNTYLNIGKKGQIVNGIVSSVGENVTLNFNGINVSVAKNAVKNPVSGDERKFKIMDVSKDSIVLKEVGNSSDTAQIRGMVNTTAPSNSYSFEECLAASEKEVQVAKDKKNQFAVLSGADYESIEDSQGSLEKMSKEVLESAIEKGKERKEWTAQKMQENKEFRKEMEENLKKIELSGFVDLKGEEQIKEILQEAGIPATKQNVNDVLSALVMSQSAFDMSDQSKAYIVEQNLAPTIDNIYQGNYTVNSAKGIDKSKDFAEYENQIDNILKNCGFDTEEGREAAKWLFMRELPVNQITLEKLSELNDISENLSPAKVVEQITFAMSTGLSAKEAVLDDTLFVVARESVSDFENIDEGTIIKVANQVNDISQVNLQFIREVKVYSDESDGNQTVNDDEKNRVNYVTLKRQIMQIRQMMTIQSALKMAKKGIQVETASLESIVNELEKQEEEYLGISSESGSEVISNKQVDLYHETINKAMDIANAHASILGTDVRKQSLLTMNVLHAAVHSQVANRQEWNGVYETVSTTIRPDLGDSIEKAFGNIPDILKEIGVENTEANNRAARILGYNSLEISKENLEEVKVLDNKVNQVIENIKPSTVVELIRKGDNPLLMPLDELIDKLKEINDEKGVDDTQKYSRYLWQLEKNNQISDDERAGYIGLYRLLHQIEKSDGAVIGAVMETSQELTLGNLLTQARIRKSSGINSVVDENTGVSEATDKKDNITSQIERGFSHDNISQTKYYQNLVEEAVEELSPDKVLEITDGEMERLLNLSVEEFCEELKHAGGNKEIKKEYYEMLAGEIRDGIATSREAEEYLQKMNIPNTVSNILAMEATLEGELSVYGEAYKRKNVLGKKENEELDEDIDSVEDSIDNEQVLNEKCESVEKKLQNILSKSYDKADISFEELQNLRMLGRGINLQGALRQSRSYDIPIRTGDTITSLNLTIIHGENESGKIQISMEDTEFGNVSLDFKISGDAVKGLVLCDQREGFELLQDNKDLLEVNVSQAGYQVKNISYGMDFKSRNEMISEQSAMSTTETAKLYQVSKILVKYVSAVIAN